MYSEKEVGVEVTCPWKVTSHALHIRTCNFRRGRTKRWAGWGSPEAIGCKWVCPTVLVQSISTFHTMGRCTARSIHNYKLCGNTRLPTFKETLEIGVLLVDCAPSAKHYHPVKLRVLTCVYDSTGRISFVLLGTTYVYILCTPTPSCPHIAGFWEKYAQRQTPKVIAI